MHFHLFIRNQGIQRRGDGKDCAPRPPKEWEVRWACLAIFFLALGLEMRLHWGRLEPAFGGNRRRFFFRLVSPAEGAGALAPVRFNFMLAAAPAANETVSRSKAAATVTPFLRHERLTVAMLLAERDQHTAPRGQKQARSGERSTR